LKPSTVYKIALKSKDSAGHEVTFTLDSVKTKAGLPGSEKVGMRAPDFALPTLDGVTVKLSDLKGKIVILNFWLTYCEACKDELPHIQDIYEKWPKDKLALLTIPLNEDAGVMRGFMLGRRLTFPVLIDAKGQADKLYEPPNFPTTYFIDSQGIIREVKVGRFDSAEEIEAILRSL
jgi:peroxiredoxin